ncbi:hypothetical protein HP266_004458 [Salmonella enterica]|nr:hypothetical protein [Salmonella enterica]
MIALAGMIIRNAVILISEIDSIYLAHRHSSLHVVTDLLKGALTFAESAGQHTITGHVTNAGFPPRGRRQRFWNEEYLMMTEQTDAFARASLDNFSGYGQCTMKSKSLAD